jgi:hypothetical protein
LLPGLRYLQWTTAAYSAPRVTNNYTNPQTPLTFGLNSGWLVFMNITDPVVYNGSTLGALFENISPTRCVSHLADETPAYQERELAVRRSIE